LARKQGKLSANVKQGSWDQAVRCSAPSTRELPAVGKESVSQTAVWPSASVSRDSWDSNVSTSALGVQKIQFVEVVANVILRKEVKPSAYVPKVMVGEHAPNHARLRQLGKVSRCLALAKVHAYRKEVPCSACVRRAGSVRIVPYPAQLQHLVKSVASVVCVCSRLPARRRSVNVKQGTLD